MVRTGMMLKGLLVILQLIAYADAWSHIVYILADDLGWNDIGYNNPDMYTPNLDNLASNGVTLNQSYVMSVCTPSRAAMLTGYYPFRTGLQHSVINPKQPKYLPLNYTLLPEKLKELGYSTHLIGKWHLGMCNWNYTPTYRGFDTFFGFYHGSQDYYEHTRLNGYDFRLNEDVYFEAQGHYSTYLTVNRTIDILDNTDPATQPLYMFLSFQSVHGPLMVPDQYLSYCSHIEDESRRTYCAMVAALDEAVGNITTALEEKGFMNNTLLVFTSDNGGSIKSFGNNLPLRGSKASLWEGGNRGVGFVYSPNLLSVSGYVNNEMMHAVDWFPTLLEVAGNTNPSSDIDGVSQWAMLSQGAPSARTEFVYNIDNLGDRAAIRVGKFKLIQGGPGNKNNNWIPLPPLLYNYTDTDGDEFPSNMLFDLENDPLEENNLAQTLTWRKNQLKKRLNFYREKLVPAVPVPDDPESNPSRYGGTWSPGWC